MIVHSAGVVGRHKNNMIYEKNELQNILFERVAEDNTKKAGCTNIQIVYKNMVFISYHFSIPMVEEWDSFHCCCVHKNYKILDKNEPQDISFKRVP